MTPEQQFQLKINDLFSLINSVKDTELKIKLNEKVTEIAEELSIFGVQLFIDNKFGDNLEINYGEELMALTITEIN